MRDLVEVAVKLVRDEEADKVRAARARRPPRSACSICCCRAAAALVHRIARASRRRPASDATREKLRAMLRDGKLDDREVEVEITDDANPLIVGARRPARHRGDRASGLKDMFGNIRPQDQAPEAQGAAGAGAR